MCLQWNLSILDSVGPFSWFSSNTHLFLSGKLAKFQAKRWKVSRKLGYREHSGMEGSYNCDGFYHQILKMFQLRLRVGINRTHMLAYKCHPTCTMAAHLQQSIFVLKSPSQSNDESRIPSPCAMIYTTISGKSATLTHQSMPYAYTHHFHHQIRPQCKQYLENSVGKKLLRSSKHTKSAHENRCEIILLCFR